MNKIMKRPDRLDDAIVSYFTGAKVKSKFYNQQGWMVDNIPAELKKNKWIPEDGKTYKCWWFYTNPSDPADPGKDILTYIEGMDDDDVERMREEYIGAVEEMMKKMSLEGLKNLVKMMK